MVTYLLYNRQTPGERLVTGLAAQLAPFQVETKLVDADSPQGIDLAEHYDALGRPAIFVVRDDGTLVQMWQGEDALPTASEISYLSHQ